MKLFSHSRLDNGEVEKQRDVASVVVIEGLQRFGALILMCVTVPGFCPALVN